MKTYTLILSLMCLPLLLLSQEVTKNTSEEFETGNNASLNIRTKFADVYFTGVSGTKVKIEVTMRVNCKDGRKAKSVLDRMYVKCSAAGNRIQITNNSESSDNEWNGKYTTETEIHIYGPVGTSLDAACSYGNLIVNQAGGANNLAIKYGMLQVNDLNGSINKLRMDYSSNSVISNISKTSCAVAYSTVEMNTASEVDLSSQYSVVNIHKVGKLKLQSVGDKIYITEAVSIQGSSQLSTIETTGLSKSFIIDAEYGSISINKINTAFTSIQIDSKFSGLTLGFEKGSNFTFDTQSEYGSITLPKKNIAVTSDIETQNTRSMKGSVGTNGKSLLKIRSTYGNTDIKINN
jgi:hypothetical protein